MASDEKKSDGLSREPGKGGYAVPPKWGKKVIKVPRPGKK